MEFGEKYQHVHRSVSFLRVCYVTKKKLQDINLGDKIIEQLENLINILLIAIKLNSYQGETLAVISFRAPSHIDKSF